MKCHKKRQVYISKVSVALNLGNTEFDQKEIWKKTNCYAYALDCNVPAPRYSRMYKLGGFSSTKKMLTIMSDEEIISRLRKDMKALGVQITKCTPDTLGRVIAVISSPYPCDMFVRYTTYHFVRRDKNAMWSHKPNWIDPPCQTTVSEAVQSYSDGHLIGYYMLSKLPKGHIR